MLTSEFEIPGYAATEALEPTHGWTTFRARRITDGQAVVIKAARFGSTTSRHLARLRNESEIAGGLDLPFVVRALGLETTANGLALAKHLFQGKRSLG